MANLSTAEDTEGTQRKNHISISVSFVSSVVESYQSHRIFSAGRTGPARHDLT